MPRVLAEGNVYAPFVRLLNIMSSRRFLIARARGTSDLAWFTYIRMEMLACRGSILEKVVEVVGSEFLAIASDTKYVCFAMEAVEARVIKQVVSRIQIRVRRWHSCAYTGRLHLSQEFPTCLRGRSFSSSYGVIQTVRINSIVKKWAERCEVL